MRRCGRSRVIAVLAAGVVACAVGAALADPAAQRVERANALLEEGKPAEALAMYEQAVEDLGLGAKAPPVITYNKGCANLALGKLPEAEADLRDALERSGDEKLRAAAAYNLGLIEAKRAEGQTKDKPEDAVTGYRKAERLFRSSFASDPSDENAATNVELSQRRIATLEQEIQKRKQEQQKKEAGTKEGKTKSDGKKQASQDQNGQGEKKEDSPKPDEQKPGSASEKLDELAKQQEKEANESSKQAQEQPRQTPEQQKQEQDKQAKDQGNLREQTKDASDQIRDMAKQQADEKAKQEMNNAADKLEQTQDEQKKAEEQLKQGKPEEASKTQEQAAEKMRQAQQNAKAAEQQLAQQKQQEQEKKDKQAKEKEKEGQEQGKEEQAQEEHPFNATAAQILDREKQIREQIEKYLRQMRARTAPVEKDW